MGEELTNFIPIFVYLAVILGFAATALTLTHLIGPKKASKVKQMTYESGMDPVGDARQPFDIGFYLVAVLFLVFDVELLFLYPWAVAAYQPDGGIPQELRSSVFAVMIFFVVTLVIAYAYAWRKGVFRWR
jgi:NADH-quinone oxidoreductase subunit A